MSIFRVEKNKNYTTMSNFHLREKEMSLKAIGLLSKILSLPDNWDYSIAGLVSICKENETAIKSALNELKQFGYLEIIKRMPDETSTGRIEYEYIIYEEPKKQDIEKQDIENLYIENQRQLNTNRLNTNNIDILDNKLSNIENFEKNDFTNLEKEMKEKEKQKKKKKKIKDAILINQILENFTTNEDVLAELKKYLAIRKKKGLSPEQWKIILDDLRKECGTNKAYAIEKIQKAIAGGWMQIVYINNFTGTAKSRYSSKPHFDNTINHELPKAVASMTADEKKNFIDNELARDENGNLIKF